MYHHRIWKQQKWRALRVYQANSLTLPMGVGDGNGGNAQWSSGHMLPSSWFSAWTGIHLIPQVCTPTYLRSRWEQQSPRRLQENPRAKVHLWRQPQRQWAPECMLGCFSRVWLFATVQTIAHQAPLSMGFSRQEYQGGLPCPSPGDRPNSGIEPTSLLFPAVAGGFFITSATWEAQASRHARLSTLRSGEPSKQRRVNTSLTADLSPGPASIS